MRLLDNFGYIDPKAKLWIAPTDSIVDGASIPQAFWSIIGGPFEGKYRNASVVHDVACERKIESWQSVHRMFYDACRCGGVDPLTAKVMYAAVFHFGPRWSRHIAYRPMPGPSISNQHEWVVFDAPMTFGKTSKMPTPTPDEVQALDKYIRQHNPSLEEVEKLDVSKLTKKHD
jgi:hypothetical protein